MGEDINEESSSIVYIFKSTYRSTFKQKILSTLSLPHNLLHEIEYDDKWISENIRKNHMNFVGKTAYMIFYDMSTQPPSFYPIRQCKVADIKPGPLYRIILKMGDYKIVTDPQKFSNTVWDYIKTKGLTKNNRVRKLVFDGDDTIEKELAVKAKQDETWEEIVEHLVEVEDIEVPPGSDKKQVQFKKSLFYRSTMIDEENFAPLNVKNEGYELEQGKEYSVSFIVYQPHYDQFSKGDIAEITFGFENKYLRHVGENKIRMPLNERIYSKNFKFWVNDIIWRGSSRVVIRREDDDFNGPHITIPIVIPRKICRWIALYTPFALGLWMLGSTSYLASLSGLAEIFWSICGTFLCSLTIWLYSRTK